MPRREHPRAWHRLLHDRTSVAIARTLAGIPHANVTFVPYQLGATPPVAAVAERRAHRRRRPMTTTAPVTAPDVVIPIAEVRLRERVTVEGEITSLLVRPLADVPTVEVRVSDATGTLPVVFLGRRRVPGLRLGTRLVVTGVVGARGRCLVAINPEYRLLAGG